MSGDRIQSGPTPFDIDAREAQVVGNPRIAPLTPAEFTDEARRLVAETFAQVEAIDKAEIPAIFGILFKHPGLYEAHMQLGNAFGRNGCIPPRERELAVLRVAWLSRSPFEWGEHLVYGKKLGLSLEDVERVTLGSSAPGWADHDRAIVRAVEELMGDYAIATGTWDALGREWSEAQLMELTGLVGHYVMTAYIYNSLRFDLLAGNTGLRRR